MSDLDSFDDDLNDRQDDIFRDDPYFQTDPSRININSNNEESIFQRVKSWLNTKILTQSRLNKLNDRGIPLYDLDPDGNPRFNFDNDTFEPISFSSRFHVSNNARNLTKREKFILLGRIFKWIILLVLSVSILIYVTTQLIHENKTSISLSRGDDGSPKLENDITNIFNSNKIKKQFNPNKLYNNGTVDFYPLSIVINLRSISPKHITRDYTPFLYNMLYPSANQLMNDDDEENYNLIGVMESNFPYESQVQDWSMLTGKFPLNNGVFNDEPMVAGNVTRSILEDINESFIDGFVVESYDWTNYTMGKTKTSRDKIETILKTIDYSNTKTRPQLILLSIDDFSELLRDTKVQDDDIKQCLKGIDKQVRTIIYEFRHRNLLAFTNVVIVSDNGIDTTRGTIDSSNVISFKDIIINSNSDPDINDKKFYNKIIKKIDRINNHHNGGMISIKIEDSTDRNRIYKLLKLGINPDEISLYVRDQLPESYHFNIKNKYVKEIDNIWLIPKPGYVIMKDDIDQKYYDMSSSIFIGHGPFFSGIVKKYMIRDDDDEVCNYLEPFNNIALYDIIGSLVGLNVKDRGRERDEYTIEYTCDVSEYEEALRNGSVLSSSNILASSEVFSMNTLVPSISMNTPVPSISVNTRISTTSTSPGYKFKINNDDIHSVIDYLKDTEESIVDNISNLINDIIGGE